MPRIPQYTQQTTASGGLSVRTFDTGGDAVLRGAQNIAQGARQVSGAYALRDEILQRKDDADSLNEVNLELTKGETKFDQFEVDNRIAKSDNPDGYTEDLAKAVDEYGANVQSLARTPKAKAYAQQQIAQMKARRVGSAIEWEANKGIERRASHWQEASDLARRAVFNDPKRYAEIEEQQGKILAESALPADVRDKLWVNFKQGLAQDAVAGMIDKRPGAVLNALKAEPGKSGIAAIDGLSADDRIRAFDKATAEVKSQVNTAMAASLVGPVRQMVDGMPVGPGDMVDMGAAKANAVAQMQARYGNLDAEQILRVENYVESAVRDKEQNIRRGREQAKATAFDALDQNGGDVEKLRTEKPDLFKALDREGLDSVNRYSGVVSTGGTRMTDWVEYNRLMDDPALLAGSNLEGMRDRFNVREYDQLLKAREQIRNKPEIGQSIVDTGMLIKDKLKEAGIGKNDTVAQARFRSMLAARAADETAVKGRKLSQSEELALADELLVQTTIAKRDLFPDKQGPAFLQEIPEEYLPTIDATVKLNGWPLDDYHRLRVYREALKMSPNRK